MDSAPHLKINILAVDDDEGTLSALRAYIEKEGYGFHAATNYVEAFDIIENTEIHLVLLDVLLPCVDGLEICARLRRDTDVPIIFLSCKGEEKDIIAGLSAGGDDYVTKPFMPGELMARIKSNLRRFSLSASAGADADASNGYMLSFCGVEANLMTREASVGGAAVNLSPKEFDLLFLFLQNPGRELTKEEIFRRIWKEPFFEGDVNTLAVHISNLRKKICGGASHPRIVAINGVGYKLI